jgi:hypothetical protein
MSTAADMTSRKNPTDSSTPMSRQIFIGSLHFAFRGKPAVIAVSGDVISRWTAT